MIGLSDALDGPRNIKSPIGSIFSLGEGMLCHETIPPNIILSHELHVKTIVVSGMSGLIFSTSIWCPWTITRHSLGVGILDFILYILVQL
jgi:hypothetical protein